MLSYDILFADLAAIRGIIMTKEITKADSGKIDLTKMTEIDLTSLDDDQQKHIMQKYNDAQVDLAVKTQQAKIDINATKATLDDMTGSVKDANDDGTSITITHSQTTSVGRTEVVMGNTERAAQGKISRSGSGLDDNTVKILVIVGVVAIIVALILKG